MDDQRAAAGGAPRASGSYTLGERFSSSQTSFSASALGIGAGAGTGAGGSPSRGSLKDDYDEKQRLERQNFDLKLKVFHLEESMKKMQDLEVRNEMSSGVARSEMSDLRLQLEEKDIELEQRDLFLMKAKAAIETLKIDLEHARQDLEKQSDVEDRVRRLKQMNDDIELDYKNQLLKLEAELNHSRQTVGLQQQEKSMLEEKNRQLELAIANMQDSHDKHNVEKGRLEDRWMQCQQQILALDEELTQSKAHVDLYRMQIQETNEDSDMVKQQLRDLAARKKDLEEAHRARVQDLSGQYEAQIKAIRANHEQDLEKLRASHAQMLADVRDNYQTELSKTRMQMERSALDAKAADGIDAQRVKDEYQQRILEKNSELKALHSLIDSDRAKYDNLVQDLEATRAELREKTFLLDQARSELAAKGDELHVMGSLRADMTSAQRKMVELQDQLRAETLEKTQVSIKLEQTLEQLDATRRTVRELEAQIHLSKVELGRLTQTTSELGSKADGVESLARDNEKLRILYNKLQQDAVEASHKIFNLNKDLEHREQEGGRLLDELRLARQEAQLLRADSAELKNSIEGQARATQGERELRLAAEASLAEQRAAQSALKSEIQDLRARLSSAEAGSAGLVSDLENKLHKLIQASAMARRSLLECDDALSDLLDGEAPDAASAAPDAHFASRLKSHAIYGSSFRAARRGQRLLEKGDSEDYDAVRDLVDHSADDVRHEIAVVIERVSLKMERATKLRSHFATQTQKVAARSEAAFGQLQERCALLLHRLESAQAEAARLKMIFDRDREASRRELEEVKKLREVLLHEHSSALRDHEDRHAQLLLAREQDKAALEQQRRSNEKLQEELRAAAALAAQQKEELRALDGAEAALAAFEHRMGALADANKALTREAQARDAALHGLEQQCNELRGEHAAAASEADKLSVQLQAKAEAIREADERIHRLLSEIERLRARQIDPELARTLRDSHEQLRRSELGTGPTSSSVTSTAQLSDLKEVEAGLRALVRKSELLLARAEAGLGDHAGAQDAERMGRLLDEMRALLQENLWLARRVDALFASWRAEGAAAPRSPQAQSARAIAADIAASALRRHPQDFGGASSAADLFSAALAPPSVGATGATVLPAYSGYHHHSTRTMAGSAARPPAAPVSAPDSSYLFPSRRALMTPTSSRARLADLGGMDLPPPYSAGPSIQLDDLRDSTDTRLRAPRTRGAATDGADPQRMSRLQKMDHSLRLLSQKLDSYELGK